MDSKTLELPRKEKKRWRILGVEFVYLYLFGIFVAFLGWVGENIPRAINPAVGVIDSRFHLLPFISPYLLISFAIHLVIGDPDHLAFFGKKLFKEKSLKACVLSNILCYAILCAGVFFGELAVGNLWEMMFGVQMWNYSGWPLTVTQYTSIVTTFGFGTAAYVIVRFIYKPMMKLICNRVPFKVAKWICLTLGVAIVLDTVWMNIQMALFGEAPIYWEIVLPHSVRYPG
jgi:uncharacterized membrane protein